VRSAFTVADQGARWAEEFCDRKILARDLCFVISFSVNQFFGQIVLLLLAVA
jgi:hypothetical protein